jgi:hypothetical protein
MSTWKRYLIGFATIVLVVLTYMITGAIKDGQISRMAAERAAAEQRIIISAQKYKEKQVQLDSVINLADHKQQLIDYMENNPQIIIQNNEKAHLNIDRLNAYNSIVRFTTGASAYENNRKRYDLHRFNPNH